VRRVRGRTLNFESVRQTFLFFRRPKLKASMMDLARGEFSAVGMTTAPVVDQHVTNPLQDFAPPKVQRTALASRKKSNAATPVLLHRDDEDTDAQGAVAETFGACKRACQGMAYDVKHWEELPAEGSIGRMQMVATRGGRLPYLVLTVSVAFLVFFSVMHTVKWLAGMPRHKKLMILDSRPVVPQPSVILPPAPVVGPPNMVPQSFA